MERCSNFVNISLIFSKFTGKFINYFCNVNIATRHKALSFLGGNDLSILFLSVDYYNEKIIPIDSLICKLCTLMIKEQCVKEHDNIVE